MRYNSYVLISLFKIAKLLKGLKNKLNMEVKSWQVDIDNNSCEGENGLENMTKRLRAVQALLLKLTHYQEQYGIGDLDTNRYKTTFGAKIIDMTQMIYNHNNPDEPINVVENDINADDMPVYDAGILDEAELLVDMPEIFDDELLESANDIYEILDEEYMPVSYDDDMDADDMPELDDVNDQRLPELDDELIDADPVLPELFDFENMPIVYADDLDAFVLLNWMMLTINVCLKYLLMS
ncbi:hypothetical protein ACKWTF_004044 [Chironomus riparius]